MEDLIDIRGKPRIYNNIELHPILMQDCIKFYQLAGCLTIEKNNSQDISVIKMSYLDFLFKLFKIKETEQLFYFFVELLKLVFREQNFGFKFNNKNKIEIFVCKNKEKFNKYNDLISQLISSQQNNNNEMIEELYEIIEQYEKNIENELFIINGTDFEEIRKIILKQNRIKFDNELLDPEVKKALEDAKKFIEKKNKNNSTTLEDQYLAYHCSIGLKYEDIDNLSIYQFTKGLEMKVHQVNFEVLGTALISGMVSMKGEMPTWIEHLKDREMYEDVIAESEVYNNFKNKDHV